MITYLYTRQGHTIERKFAMGKAPSKVRHRGGTYERVLFVANERQPPRCDLWRKPLRCAASGVDRTDAKAATEDAQARGFKGVSFCEKSGDALYETRAERKRYQEAEQLFDRQGGYGDAQPR